VSGGYAELHCLSNFSFQRGASSAKELFERASLHGYQALAITDECTLAGIVRAWQAAKECELPLIIGSEITVENGPKIVLLVENLAGYQALCRLITQGRRRSKKGEYRLLHEDFQQPVAGLLALWLPDLDETSANGCVGCFSTTFGWGSSCIAVRMTGSGWTRCWNWREPWLFRPSPAAMYTCTLAVAGRCRTP
jgi:hypothetical protein